MRVAFAALVAALFLFGCGPNNRNDKEDSTWTPLPPATSSLKGTSFGESFTAGYSYAVVDSGEKSINIVIGNGRMNRCFMISQETASVVISVPYAVGVYSDATPKTAATYDLNNGQSTPFSRYKVTVSKIAGDLINGSVELASATGSIAGAFAAKVCR